MVAAGKRLVITTCLTGQGTARKLAAFLTEALPPDLRESVAVQAVDLDNGSVLPGLLVEGWRKGVVAVVGTIDPRLPGVPFIGLERVLFGDGLQALADLLRGEEAPAAAPSATREEAMELATRFLVDNITSVDGRRAGEAAVDALRRFEESPGDAAERQPGGPVDHPPRVCHRAARQRRDHLPLPGGGVSQGPARVAALGHRGRPGARRTQLGLPFPSGEIAYMALIVLTE